MLSKSSAAARIDRLDLRSSIIPLSIGTASGRRYCRQNVRTASAHPTLIVVSLLSDIRRPPFCSRSIFPSVILLVALLWIFFLNPLSINWACYAVISSISAYILRKSEMPWKSWGQPCDPFALHRKIHPLNWDRRRGEKRGQRRSYLLQGIPT